MKYWLIAVQLRGQDLLQDLEDLGVALHAILRASSWTSSYRPPARAASIPSMSERDPLVPAGVAAGRRRWREASDKAFGKVPSWKKDWTTVSGAAVDPLAGPDALAGFDSERDLGWPGEYPFTRGVQPTGYRGKLWTMRQFAGFGTAKQTNERFHYLLEHGQTGLSTAFHLPTLYGYDSDHEMARGEVGKCGVAIDSLATWRSCSTASTSAASRPR